MKVSIAHAARTMMNQRVGALAVVDDGQLVGIVTESDIFKYLSTHLDMPD